MILYPLLGIYAYVHTHIHVCLVDRQYKIKEIHTDCFGSSKYFHKNMFMKISQKFNNLSIVNVVTVSWIRKLWKTDS